MQLTIDSGDSLDRVLPVLSAMYGVEITAATLAVVPRARSGGLPRRNSGSPGNTAKASRVSGRRLSRTKPDSATIRAWARANGHDVKDRGRVPAGVVTAYLAGSA